MSLYFRDYENVTDPRLRRNVLHDSESLNYQVEPKPRKALQSTRHTSKIPPLDQGNLGSCVGDSSTKCFTYQDEFWEIVKDVLSTTDADLDQQYAVQFYSDCTKADPFKGEFPPTDTGTNGLTAGKVAVTRKIASGYLHCTSFDAVTTALAETAIITGTDWHEDSFTPDPDGRIHITGAVAGGHEYVLDEINFEKRQIWMQQSWGPKWGLKSRGYFTFDDYESLLYPDGDATKFLPITQPAPVPVPVDPTPVPTNVDQFDINLDSYLSTFFSRNERYYIELQRRLKTWQAGKGFAS